MARGAISQQALRRLPVYLNYLKQLSGEGVTYVTARRIAEHMKLSEIQVRKDIETVSSRPGKPMVGFEVDGLIRDLTAFLAYDKSKDAVLVGVGALGSALFSYGGFNEYGLRIVAAFDETPEQCGRKIDAHVYSMDELEPVCAQLNVQIGIIAVPAAAAQRVCDRLIQSGVRAIWNFAPVHLSVPDGILVQNENMAASLAVLSHCLDKLDDAEPQ